MSKNLHKWMTKRGPKTLLHKDHEKDLFGNAADYEFVHHFTQSNAEDRAYEDYRKGHLKEGAKHHYRAMRAAHGAGDTDAAKKHAQLYEWYLKEFDHTPQSAPPDWIRDPDGKDSEAQPVKLRVGVGHEADQLLDKKPDWEWGENPNKTTLGKNEEFDYPESPEEPYTGPTGYHDVGDKSGQLDVRPMHPVVAKIHKMYSLYTPEELSGHLDLLRSGVMQDHEYAPGVRLSGIIQNLLTNPKPKVKKSEARVQYSDLPQWAQVKLLSIAVENLSKAKIEKGPAPVSNEGSGYEDVEPPFAASDDGIYESEGDGLQNDKIENRKTAGTGNGATLCSSCHGAGVHAETGDDCPECDGWGDTFASGGEEVKTETPFVPFKPKEPLDLNDVAQLRSLFGNKVPQDYDPGNASHWGALINSLDPKERDVVMSNLFSHDRWRAAHGKGPQTKSGLNKSDKLHYIWAKLPDEILQGVADLVKKDYIKSRLKKAIAEKLLFKSVVGGGKLAARLGAPAGGVGAAIQHNASVNKPQPKPAQSGSVAPGFVAARPGTAEFSSIKGSLPADPRREFEAKQSPAGAAADKAKLEARSSLLQRLSGRKASSAMFLSEKKDKKKINPHEGLRDEGIRVQKLPPGAPGANKQGVGVQRNRKKYNRKDYKGEE